MAQGRTEFRPRSRVARGARPLHPREPAGEPVVCRAARRQAALRPDAQRARRGRPRGLPAPSRQRGGHRPTGLSGGWRSARAELRGCGAEAYRGALVGTHRPATARRTESFRGGDTALPVIRLPIRTADVARGTSGAPPALGAGEVPSGLHGAHAVLGCARSGADSAGADDTWPRPRAATATPRSSARTPARSTRRAMLPATRDTVRGNFDGATFRKDGVTTRFFRRDGRYFVNTDGPDGKLADYEVKYTFGVEPLQQYLVEFPGGRLQALSVAWDTVGKAVVSRLPAPSASTTRTSCTGPAPRRTGTRCARRATRRRCARITMPATGTYRTTSLAPGVGCQALPRAGVGAPRLGARATGRARARRAGRGLPSTSRRVGTRAGRRLRVLPRAARHVDRRVPARGAAARPRTADRHWTARTISPTDSSARRCSSSAPGCRAGCTRRAWSAPTATTRTPASRRRRATRCARAATTRPGPRPGRAIDVGGLKRKAYDSPAHTHHAKPVGCVQCHAPKRTYMVVDPGSTTRSASRART